jgi:uncharacterized protein YcfJ
VISLLKKIIDRRKVIRLNFKDILRIGKQAIRKAKNITKPAISKFSNIIKNAALKLKSAWKTPVKDLKATAKGGAIAGAITEAVFSTVDNIERVRKGEITIERAIGNVIADTSVGAISGTAGAIAGAKAGAVIGTLIGGPIGTVVGAGVGLVVGAIVGTGVSWVLERVGVKKAISDAVTSAAKLGSEVVNKAKKAIDNIAELAGKFVGSIFS